MLDQSLLWNRAIGSDGRLTKEPTLLGAVLIGIALFAAGAILLVLGAAL